MHLHRLQHQLRPSKTRTSREMKKFHRLTKQPAIIALVVWFSLAWSWTFFTDSLDLAGSKSQGLILAAIISAINVAISVLVIWKAIRIAQWIFKQYSPPKALVLSLGTFALADFLVSWLSTIIWLGPEGRIDNILPLSSPTLVIINTPLGFASRLVGFFGLGAFVWLLLFLLWNKPYRKLAAIPAGLLLVLSLSGWIAYKTPDSSTFTAKIISEALDNRVPTIDARNTELTIFPEYGLDEITNEKLGERIIMNDPSDSRERYFLGSEQVNPQDPNGPDVKAGHLNRLLFGNTIAGYTYKQDKYRLIPGGEDLAYTVRLGLRATNQKATLDYFSYAKGTLRGSTPLAPFRISESTLVGAAVCSSIIAPQDYRKFAKEGSTVFTNSASLTIFKGSPIFAFQQKSLARFMAVANSRYFLQSANSARAYALDNNGKTIAEGSGSQVLDVTAQNNTKRTIYTLTGEWLVYLGVIAAIWLVYLTKLRGVVKHKNPLHKT